MTSRKVLLSVLSAAALLTSTGYQSAASASSTVGSPVGQGENHARHRHRSPRAKKIGTPANGFSVAIPKGWVDIDLTAADSKRGWTRQGSKAPARPTSNRASISSRASTPSMRSTRSRCPRASPRTSTASARVSPSRSTR